MIKTLLILILQIAILIAVLIGLGLAIAKLSDVVAYFYLKSRSKRQRLDFQVVWANYKLARAKERNLIKGDYELASHPHEKRKGNSEQESDKNVSTLSSKSSSALSKLTNFLFVPPRVRKAKAQEEAQENDAQEETAQEQTKDTTIHSTHSDADEALSSQETKNPEEALKIHQEENSSNEEVPSLAKEVNSKASNKKKKAKTFFGQYSAQRHALSGTYSLLSDTLKKKKNSKQDK